MDVENLIELVRAHSVLYALSHPDYLKARLKDELWEKIGAELNSDGKTIKEQWRKLRECHREALRRQKKKGDQSDYHRPWLYQHQMEFLLPYMKNRGNSTNIKEYSADESTLNENEDMPHFGKAEGGESSLTDLNGEVSQPVKNETPTPKKIKLRSDFVPPSLFEASQNRVKSREELNQQVILSGESQTRTQDSLFQFFMAMYCSTKGLPGKHQREVKRKIFEAVSQAEEEYENESPGEPH